MLLQFLLHFRFFSWVVVLFCLTSSVNAKDVKHYIPPQAMNHIHTLIEVQQSLFPEHPKPHYVPALIEHESCISLTHSRCWNPKSRFKTSREEGGGFGQLTRAYRRDGSLRFDALTELVIKHPVALNGLSWNTLYGSPTLQLKAIVLKLRDNWKRLKAVKNPIRRMMFVDASYNGGLTHVYRERSLCGLRKNCDPQQWFGNVASIKSVKSNRILYGNRSAWKINRDHVDDVILNRMMKYDKLYQEISSLNYPPEPTGLDMVNKKPVDNKNSIDKDCECK